MSNVYIYLAGSSNELPRVKRAAQWLERLNAELKEAGDEAVITNAWWTDVESAGANPAGAESHARRAWAAADLQGVKDADIFWMLFPEEPTSSGGCFWEAGFADSLDTQMVLSGPTERSIFSARACEYASDEAAFRYISDTIRNMLADLSEGRCAEAAVSPHRSAIRA